MPDTLTLGKEYLSRSKQFYTLVLESLGGQLITIRPTDWPTFEELTVRMDNLNYTEKETILTFLQAHQGIKIDLEKTYNPGISGNACDDLNEVVKTWRGFITSSRVIIGEPKYFRGDCSTTGIYTIVFTFQGNLVIGP